MSDMAVEVLKQQLADLTRDYTGACEAIRQLEANVAEARAEVERTNHIMRLERMARQDSEDRLKTQLTAAEAAREAVLAALDWLAWGVMVALLAVVLVNVARQAWRDPAQAAMVATIAGAYLALCWAINRLLSKADR